MEFMIFAVLAALFLVYLWNFASYIMQGGMGSALLEHGKKETSKNQD